MQHSTGPKPHPTTPHEPLPLSESWNARWPMHWWLLQLTLCGCGRVGVGGWDGGCGSVGGRSCEEAVLHSPSSPLSLTFQWPVRTTPDGGELVLSMLRTMGVVLVHTP